MKKILALSIILLITQSALQAQTKTRILFVFDASNSMNGYWEKERKITIATRLLIESLEELKDAENVELALRVYGHQTKHVPGQQDCDDTELMVPFAEKNNLIIAQALERLIPQGTTPIARSLEKGAGDFPEEANVRNVIILITDGIEACDEDPCAVSRALQKKGIILKPFIIGIGIEDKYKTTFECVGNYFDAGTEESFKHILDIVVTQALNNTTVQIDLLDSELKPLVTNLPMTLYDARTGQVLYDYVHTLNSRGNPDTLTLDPLYQYDLVVHTIPTLELKSLSLTPGKHETWSLNAVQGKLNLAFDGGRSDYSDLQCIVRRAGECEPIHVQGFGTVQEYLVGTYDLEILSNPRTYIPGVKVEANKTSDVLIPKPGALLLQTGGAGYGGIFRMKDSKLEQVVPFSDGNPSGRYVLQPGQYTIIFRARQARQTIYTLEKQIDIRSGGTSNLSF